GAVDLAVRPAEVADRLAVGGVLGRALPELLHRLVDLARVILGVALVLVAHRLHDVLDAAGTVRVASFGSPKGPGHDQAGENQAACEPVNLHWKSSFR